jgi:hypothetical protein
MRLLTLSPAPGKDARFCEPADYADLHFPSVRIQSHTLTPRRFFSRSSMKWRRGPGRGGVAAPPALRQQRPTFEMAAVFPKPLQSR